MGRSYSCTHAATLIRFLPCDSALVAALNRDMDNRDPFSGMDARRLDRLAESLGVRR